MSVPDYTVRMRDGKDTPYVRSTIIGALMAACIYEGEDYDLVVSSDDDPLEVEGNPNVPSGKQLYFAKKLHEEMSTRFARAKDLDENDTFLVRNTLHHSRVELEEGGLTKRRVSDIIDALKSLGGLI